MRAQNRASVGARVGAVASVGEGENEGKGEGKGEGEGASDLEQPCGGLRPVHTRKKPLKDVPRARNTLKIVDRGLNRPRSALRWRETRVYPKTP